MRLIIGLLISALLLGACTSGGDSASDEPALTLEAWAAIVCESRGELASVPAPASLADFVAFQEVADVFAATAAKFEAIDPPSRASASHRQLVQLYEGISDAQGELIQAISDGDGLDDATIEYNARLQQVFDGIDPVRVNTEVEDALRDAGCDSPGPDS